MSEHIEKELVELLDQQHKLLQEKRDVDARIKKTRSALRKSQRHEEGYAVYSRQHYNKMVEENSRFRELIVGLLRNQENMSFKEIGGKLGFSAGRAQNLHQAYLRRLRQEIPWEGENND